MFLKYVLWTLCKIACLISWFLNCLKDVTGPFDANFPTFKLINSFTSKMQCLLKWIWYYLKIWAARRKMWFSLFQFPPDVIQLRTQLDVLHSTETTMSKDSVYTLLMLAAGRGMVKYFSIFVYCIRFSSMQLLTFNFPIHFATHMFQNWASQWCMIFLSSSLTVKRLGHYGAYSSLL